MKILVGQHLNRTAQVLTGTIIRKGYSPYIDDETGTWWEYDEEEKAFVDTEVVAAGEDGEDGTDGTSPTVSISKTGTVTTVTITDASGAHTATINDGQKGNKGDQGESGISPSVSISKSGKVTTITITDATGEHTATINDGEDGSSASITAAAIAEALGYTPADAEGLANTDQHIAEDIEPALEQLNEDLADKLDKPSNTVSVGKVLKVKTVNADGTFVCEWADDNNTQTDVQINGTSITQDGVANIPVMTNTTYGVCKYSTSYGTSKNSNGQMIIYKATDSDVLGHSDQYRPIVPYNVVPAVNSVICSDNPTEQLTVAQQSKALTRLGAEKAKGEWVLKGTVSGNADDRGNIDSGCTVDLSGCTEMIIIGKAIATANVHIMTNQYRLAYSAYTTSKKSYYSRYVDSLFGIDCVVVRNSTSETGYTSYISDVGNADCWYNGKHISDITTIYLSTSSSVTSCNIKIYAR